jgi:type IV secretion system protein VirD4
MTLGRPPGGARLLWGQSLLVLGLVAAFVWAATEWTAWRLAW